MYELANMTTRTYQHNMRPNRRRKADVAKYTPFKEHFVVRALLQTYDASTANALERHEIRVKKTTGPLGYNIFQGAPKYNNRFWAMMQARKKPTWMKYVRHQRLTSLQPVDKQN